MSREKRRKERKKESEKYLSKRHIAIIFTLGEGSIVFVSSYAAVVYVLVERG